MENIDWNNKEEVLKLVQQDGTGWMGFSICF